VCALSEHLLDPFPTRKHYENYYGRRIGWHDNAQGVQWGCYTDSTERRAKRVFLIVNLEGKKYGYWPIATLINQERDNPTLHNFLGTISSVDGIELIWMRDNWLTQRYREVDDDFFADTPTPLSYVTREVWLKCLSEARACLSPDNNGRGRGASIVRRASGGRSETSPHLQFRLLMTLPTNSGDLNSRENFNLMLWEGRKKLGPLYDFVAERSAA
jgi:hypothetical protein